MVKKRIEWGDGGLEKDKKAALKSKGLVPVMQMECGGKRACVIVKVRMTCICVLHVIPSLKNPGEQRLPLPTIFIFLYIKSAAAEQEKR